MFAPVPTLLAVAVRWSDRLTVWPERLRQRRALIALSDRALHDLGIGRADAWAEYAKPFWRD